MGEQIELEDWIAEKMARRKKTKKKLRDCVACGNTRVSTSGRPCVCVTIPSPNGLKKKKVVAKKSANDDTPEKSANDDKPKRRRRKKASAKPMPEVVKRRPKKSKFEVGFIKREARHVFTSSVGDIPPPDKARGAIIRVKGSESDATADLDEWGQFLIENGATAYKTLSAPVKPTLTGSQGNVVELSAIATPREAVEAILEEENDDALTDVAEDSMSRVGL